MTAGYWDITIEQGATFLQSFLIKDGGGDVLDLTGCAASMQIRTALGDPSAILSLTTANGGLLINAPNGTITPVFPTDGLVPGRYVYDLKLVDSGGESFRLLRGFACVSGEVTTL